MFTDTPPCKSDLNAFRESSWITTLDIPDGAFLPQFVKMIESTIKARKTANVRGACEQFLKTTSFPQLRPFSTSNPVTQPYK